VTHDVCRDAMHRVPTNVTIPTVTHRVPAGVHTGISTAPKRRPNNTLDIKLFPLHLNPDYKSY